MAGKRARGFVTAGTWCLDRNRIIDHWPREDSVGQSWGLEERGGGSACNLGIDMRKLDPSIPVETIGLIGDDAAGRALVAEARAVGIDTTQMHVTDAAPTHATDAYVSAESGLRTHISDLGCAEFLAPKHFDVEATFGLYFHLGLPGIHPGMDCPSGDDANGWETVLKAARAAGMKTNLELCTVPPETLRTLVLPCLAHLDTLIVNDSEIGALAEIPTVDGEKTDVAACEAAARSTLEKGQMWLAVVHFPTGGLAVPRDGEAVFVPSVNVPADAIAGPNGAGDAFAAGFLYGIHEDWPLADSLWMGHAAAACSIRKAGTTDGVEDWRSCLEIADGWGRRPR